MYVGTLANSCEFSRPSAKVKHYLEIDRQLNKIGLVENKPDPAAYKQVKKEGEDPENGLPISCYQMTLTEQGFNVRQHSSRRWGPYSRVTRARRALP